MSRTDGRCDWHRFTDPVGPKCDEPGNWVMCREFSRHYNSADGITFCDQHRLESDEPIDTDEVWP